MVHTDLERIGGAVVIRSGAFWLNEHPWIWKCPRCRDVYITGTTEKTVIGQAKTHFEHTHS